MISSVSSSYNQSYYLEMRQQMFNNIDTDGDGKHSRDEITAMVANGHQGGPSVDDIFSKADTDGDGYISESEFDAVQEQGTSPVQGSDSSDDLIKSLLEALEEEDDTTSTTAGNESQTEDSAVTLAQMLSAALQSYLQNAGCFSQSNIASTLLGSNVYA